jgi:hypothetical protein
MSRRKRMSKLNIAYIIENDEDVFELSYNSIKDTADNVVIVDGNPIMDKKLYSCMKIEQSKYHDKITLINSPFPHKEKGAMGIQRNKYLNYLKEHHLGEWCLVLDSDEVVQHPENLKKLFYHDI